MKRLLLLPLLVLALLAAAQTDSLEIKLQQYKGLLQKGLIDSAEYQKLKARELDMAPTTDKKGNKAFGKHRFNVRINPVFYYDVLHRFKLGGNNKTYTYNYLTYSAGVHIQAGPCIKDRYFPNLSIGFEAAPSRVIVPVNAAFAMKILSKKISPLIQAEAGYVFVKSYHGLTGEPTDKNHGMNALLGLGLHVPAAKHFAINITPEYRFLFYRFNYLYIPVPLPQNEFLTTRKLYPRFVHQVGIRVQFIIW
ncbi:MAG TPA: hypothetical protein PLW44_11610 [Chitinophagales bacterium]|nr:hypothetical protein [Chitinophagales bacterium]